jgi:hypothetical protein
VWQQALTTCFLKPATPQREISAQFGARLPLVLQDWFWFYSLSEGCVYHKEVQAFQVYSRNA